MHAHACAHAHLYPFEYTGSAEMGERGEVREGARLGVERVGEWGM